MEYNNSNFNQQSSRQPFVLPGSAAFTPGENDFPAFGSEGSQNNAANDQQLARLFGITPEIFFSDNPFKFKPTAEFNFFASKEFVPGNAIIKEEFPDLDQAVGAP